MVSVICYRERVSVRTIARESAEERVKHCLCSISVFFHILVFFLILVVSLSLSLPLSLCLSPSLSLRLFFAPHNTYIGRDTTAQTLSWLFYNLCSHPEEEKRVVEEIDKLLHNNTKSPLLPTYDIVQQMHYTEAVVWETLRLYPPVPRDPKQAVKDDVLPSGFKVPAGTGMCVCMCVVCGCVLTTVSFLVRAVVLYAPWIMGRQEKLWKNAMKFDPSRMYKAKIDHYKLPVFQAG